MHLLACFSALVSAIVLASLGQTSAATIKNRAETATVNLGYATYQGSFNSTANITSFLGMRFAAPPIGKLRFQAPLAPANISGVQLADVVPRTCPNAMYNGFSDGSSAASPFVGLTKRQSGSDSGTEEIEDCLFLNVFVSGEVKPNAKLPVLVWIHGGGYAVGGLSSYNSADSVAEAGGGLVSVAMQYRLGLFGFIAGKEVKEKGSLNNALLDQEFALKWVQQHIHLFGGDASKVTIWGYSAGAGSVLQHLVAHGGNTQPQLFRAAMTSSTFVPPQFNYDDPEPEDMYSRVLEITNCTDASVKFGCLVNVDAATLNYANGVIAALGFWGTFDQVPVVDGDFIVERPTTTMKRGKLNGKMLYSNTNSYEGRFFMNTNLTDTMTTFDYARQIFTRFNTSQLAQVVELYGNIGSTYDNAVAIYGEAIIICPTHFLLPGFSGRAYKSTFAAPPAEHGMDIQILFPDTDVIIGPSPNNATLLASIDASYMSFAKSLNPNVHAIADDITPHWDLYSDGNAEMVFNITAANQSDIYQTKTDEALLKRCAWLLENAASIPY